MKEEEDIKNLLARLSRNDANAFRRIFHLFSDKVYSFALRLTRSDVDAEEMVQEVFLRVWTGRESLASVENFDGYLFIMTRNLVLNAIRKNAAEEKARAAAAEKTEKHHQQTEETVIYEDYQRLVNQTISRLPSQQRLVYSMCQQEGLQYEEVAQRLNISRLTVKTHMQQALRTIRHRVGTVFNH